MGTETYQCKLLEYSPRERYVKLNNPLMGTETGESIWSDNEVVGKLN